MGSLPATATASRVQGHAEAIANRRHFGDRLEHARLVVAQGRADQPGLGAQQPGEAIRADQSGGVDAQGVEPPALFHQPLGRLDHAGVFDRGDDDLSGLDAVRRTWAIPRTARLLASVPLAGENQPVRLEVAEVGAENFGDLLAGIFQAAAGTLPRLVLAGRVGVTLGEASGNGVGDLRAGRRRRAVVEVDRLHFQIIDASCCLSKVCVAGDIAVARKLPRPVSCVADRVALTEGDSPHFRRDIVHILDEVSARENRDSPL